MRDYIKTPTKKL